MRVSRRLAALGVALAVSVPNVAMSSATHSIPSPVWWWDKDNDGLRESTEGTITYSPQGNLWTDAKKARFADAARAWRDNTSWDPLWGVATGQGVYVDGRLVCGTDTWASAGQPPAANCVARTRKVNQKGTTYYDISDSDIYINLLYVWHFGDAQGLIDVADYEGIMTHEVGHGISLVDLLTVASCGNPIVTMCGTGAIAGNGFVLRTLELGDIQAANTVY